MSDNMPPADDWARAGAHFDKGEYQAALEIYRAFAERGSVPAQVCVGRMYYNGMGGRKDPQEAREWFERAAGAGSAQGQFFLAKFYLAEKDYPKALEYFEKAASQEYPPAFFCLGYVYERGLGVPVDEGKAMSFYERAASSGNVWARRRLATEMIEGRRGLRQVPRGICELARVALSGLRLAIHDLEDVRLQR